MKKYNSVIIGAGAAGLMCAYQLGKNGKSVALLDHSTKLAEKIRISGGGFCNFTNIYTSPNCYISKNPHFCISALSKYTPQDFTSLLDKFHINYHEKTLGQLFCDKNSLEIINLLDFLCNENNVIRHMGVSINEIESTNSGFEINSSIGIFKAETLIIATGGLSIPQIGATGFGYEIARKFGLKIVEPKPALVPLTLPEEKFKNFTALSGTSFYSEVSTKNKIRFLENSLITHRGLSGPAILQISSYWDHKETIVIDMLPNLNIEELIYCQRHSLCTLSNFLTNYFSARLSNNITETLKIDKQICQLSNLEIKKIAEFIHKFVIIPSGTQGFKKAEVTKGGVDTNELSSKSLMSNKIDGLFFIGEVVDVTGWLGGYNFQWAWSSAYAAANYV